ncbi:hypothetical protein N5925_11630, partial [Glaesserella parasuis]|nr:hypothetical protein [Glaesserella parasuis]
TYRFINYIGIVKDYLNGIISSKEIPYQISLFNRVELSDKVARVFREPLDSSCFNYTVVENNKCKLVYLDQNVISNGFEDKDRIKEILDRNNLIMIYSPNHLEEVNRLPNEDEVNRFLNLLRELTKNYCLLPKPNGAVDEHILAIEDPIFSLKRVRYYQDVSIAFENHTREGVFDREFLFPEYENKEHKDMIANENDIFNSLTNEEFSRVSFNVFGTSYNKSDFNVESINKEFLLKIKVMYKIMDLLGYKLEKKKNRYKAGAAYDPEHLVYALKCDYFVTNDKNLMCRAKQIVKFINLNVEILEYNEFINKFEGTLCKS